MPARFGFSLRSLTRKSEPGFSGLKKQITGFRNSRHPGFASLFLSIEQNESPNDRIRNPLNRCTSLDPASSRSYDRCGNIALRINIISLRGCDRYRIQVAHKKSSSQVLIIVVDVPFPFPFLPISNVTKIKVYIAGQWKVRSHRVSYWFH